MLCNRMAKIGAMGAWVKPGRVARAAVTGLTGTFAHVKEPDSRKTFAVLSIEELDIRSMSL